MNACDNAASFDKGFGEAAAPRDAVISALRAALAEAQKRLERVEEAARECRRLDALSVEAQPSGDDKCVEAWEQWWDGHCKLHDAAYAALDAALAKLKELS